MPIIWASQSVRFAFFIRVPCTGVYHSQSIKTEIVHSLTQKNGRVPSIPSARLNVALGLSGSRILQRKRHGRKFVNRAPVRGTASSSAWKRSTSALRKSTSDRWTRPKCIRTATGPLKFLAFGTPTETIGQPPLECRPITRLEPTFAHARSRQILPDHVRAGVSFTDDCGWCGITSDS